MDHPTRNLPSPTRCFGRAELCREVIKEAMVNGAVLLFGGMLSGKTTLLLYIEAELQRQTGHIAKTASVDVPVYTNLMRIVALSTPKDFYNLCINLASEACQRQIQGFIKPELMSFQQTPNVEVFERDVSSLLDACGQTEVRFLFLIDETKRILGEGFSPEFRGNLFYLLFGSQKLAGRCNFVFAGAQELDLFIEDGTSPIGTRVPKLWLDSFPSAAPIKELMVHFLGSDKLDVASRRAVLIFRFTGGHAGLSAYLAERFTGIVVEEEEYVNQEVLRFLRHRAALFQSWTKKLSREAQFISELLVDSKKVLLLSIPGTLAGHHLDPFKTDAAVHELLFTGIAATDEEFLQASNRMYFDWVARPHFAAGRSDLAYSLGNLGDISQPDNDEKRMNEVATAPNQANSARPIPVGQRIDKSPLGKTMKAKHIIALIGSVLLLIGTMFGGVGTSCLKNFGSSKKSSVRYSLRVAERQGGTDIADAEIVFLGRPEIVHKTTDYKGEVHFDLDAELVGQVLEVEARHANFQPAKKSTTIIEKMPLDFIPLDRRPAPASEKGKIPNDMGGPIALLAPSTHGSSSAPQLAASRKTGEKLVLSGIVIDDDDERPVTGASVSLDEQPGISDSTTSRGEFLLQLRAPVGSEKIRLRVDATGYKIWNERVAVPKTGHQVRLKK